MAEVVAKYFGRAECPVCDGPPMDIRVDIYEEGQCLVVLGDETATWRTNRVATLGCDPHATELMTPKEP